MPVINVPGFVVNDPATLTPLPNLTDQRQTAGALPWGGSPRETTGMPIYDPQPLYRPANGFIIVRNPLTPGYNGAGFTGSIFSSSIFVPQDRSGGSVGYVPGGFSASAFTLQRIDTGFSTDADFAPTGLILRAGAVTAVPVSITKIGNRTGCYVATYTIPADWLPGDSVTLLVTASVNGIQGTDKVDEYSLGGSQGGSGGASAEEIATTLLDTQIAGHAGAGSVGGALSRVGVIEAALTALTTLANAIKAKTDALFLDGSGRVRLDLSQPLPRPQAAGSIGRVFQLVRGFVAGKRVIDGAARTETIYDTDNSTVLVTSQLTPSSGPVTTRTSTTTE